MGKFSVIRNGAIGTLLALSTSLSVSTFVHADTTTPLTANVTVNAASTLGTVPSTALGVNTAVWDHDLTDPAIPGLLKQINTAMLRYPGGSTSDIYHWANNTRSDGGWTNPNDGFDNFMKMDQAAGAEPIITVNGGDNNPQEAAAWVQDANVTHNYGIKYWEIGNELYGSWENGNFANNPTGYAQLASDYIKAMKAVDPTIKIGVDLIAPGTGEADWNSTVLSQLQSLGTPPDFGIVHWYALNPGGETDASLLSSTNQIPTMMSTLKQQLGNIPVFVTETNDVSYNPGRQSTSLVNALFLDDNITNWLQAGAANVDWWDLYNGIVTAKDGANVDPGLYGSYNYGDYGLLSSGSTGDDGSVEPPVNTPFPDYYGYQMLGAVVQPGAQMVAAGSENNLVSVHASKLPNGNLAVMIINKDPNNTYNVNLNVEGYLAQSAATELYYGEGSSSVSQSQVSNVGSIQAAPYSVTDLVLTPQTQNQQGQQGQVKDSTTVASSAIKPGYTQTVTATFKDPDQVFENATLVVEVDDPSGRIVAQQVDKGVSDQQGNTTSTAVTLNWKALNVQGTYTVKAFAFSGNGGTTYLADQNAGTFTVTQPDPPVISAQVSLSAATVKVGTPVTITTTYTETAPTGYLTNGLLVQYAVYNNWTSSTQSAPSASLDPGQTITESWTITPAQAGTYTFPEGIFTSGWKQLQWINQSSPVLTVTN